MDPARLSVWTSIGVNYATYQPTVKQILERYMLKFSKGGTIVATHQDDLGLIGSVEDDNDDGGSEGYYVQGTQAQTNGD